MKIRAVIVDDEPLARKKLRMFLADEGDVDVIKECGNGREAADAVVRYRPDVLFLDIQMPELDGFGVIESVARHHLPFIVFVTAHDTFAVKAFEIHALDYLLKPFDRERLRQSLHHVRKALQQHSLERHHGKILSLLGELESKQSQPRRILVKSAGRIYFVALADIEWVEAEGNYLRLHVGNETHLIRQTLNSMEQQLGADHFIRIHRSTLVNTDRIKELQPWFAGEYLAILNSGKKLTVSKSYRKRLTGAFALPK